MTTSAILSPRQTKHAEFLDAIATANDAGRLPSKADLVGNVPTKTRANHYRMIGRLIEMGLVENATSRRNAYALRVTVLGRTELAR